MNTKGRFGQYGGQYVPEIVMPALNELETAYLRYKEDPDFQNQFRTLLREYAAGQQISIMQKSLQSIMAAPGSSSSGKISCTQGRIRSTMRSGRLFWLSSWGRSESLQRRERGSMALLLLQWLLCSGWNVTCSWAHWM